jgi:hypothetical protein
METGLGFFDCSGLLQRPFYIRVFATRQEKVTFPLNIALLNAPKALSRELTRLCLNCCQIGSSFAPKRATGAIGTSLVISPCQDAQLQPRYLAVAVAVLLTALS